jgi:hypothetical protein
MAAGHQKQTRKHGGRLTHIKYTVLVGFASCFPASMENGVVDGDVVTLVHRGGAGPPLGDQHLPRLRIEPVGRLRRGEEPVGLRWAVRPRRDVAEVVADE